MAKQRKTLEQMAAEARSNPWACPRCGCMDWRTVDSYFCVTTSMRHRRQRCRHCSYTRMTWESATPPSDDGEPEKLSHVPTNGTCNQIALTVVREDANDTLNEHAGDIRRRSRAGRTGT